MTRTRYWMILVGILVGVPHGAGSAFAVAPVIKDEAKLFTPDAVKKANKEIREIARKYERDLLIESLSGLPSDQAERVKSMSAAERGNFLRNWASDRAESAVVQGVYILILKDQPHLVFRARPRQAGNNQQHRRRKCQADNNSFRQKAV